MSTSKNNDGDAGSSKNTEGYLTKRLLSAFELTTEKFLSSIKFSRFKKRYMTIYEINPDELKRIYNEWISQMNISIQEDFRELYSDLRLDFLLNNLEKINDGECSNVAWRPSGNPDEDLRDHIYPVKLKHKDNLENLLNQVKAENEKLVNDSALLHADIMHIKKVNDDLHGEFSNIATSLSGPNLQKLKRNLRNAMPE